jgi:hypothetical protein
MGWDFHTYQNQPVHFLHAIEYWQKKDYEKENKAR